MKIPNSLQVEAEAALENCHIPYKNTAKLGVALLTDAGTFCGTTFQNCAYPSSLCAVQLSIASAITSGASQLHAVFIIYNNSNELDLCGRCKEYLKLFNQSPLYTKKVNSDKIEATVLSDIIGEIQLSPPLQNRTETVPIKEISKYQSADLFLATDIQELCQKAIEAVQYAYVPLSYFPVGCAVDTDKGIFLGCNVELFYLHDGICAEINAIGRAISNGAKKIKKLAVCCWKLEKEFGYPCGSCRQVMVEMGDFDIYLISFTHSKHNFEIQKTTLFQLLPHAFVPAALNELKKY